MKRLGHLWENVVSFKALLRAADEARRGKRFRPAVAAFHFDQERALWKLHEELSTKTYRPGGYRSFFIYEPARRFGQMLPRPGRSGRSQGSKALPGHFVFSRS